MLTPEKIEWMSRYIDMEKENYYPIGTLEWYEQRQRRKARGAKRWKKLLRRRNSSPKTKEEEKEILRAFEGISKEEEKK